MRILLGQVLPASTAPQNPQNPFQDTAVVDPRTATLAVLARFGKQGSDFLPLHFRQQRTRPGHRPSFGAADFAYLASEKTQLPSFQEPVLGYATASIDRHSCGSERPCDAVLGLSGGSLPYTSGDSSSRHSRVSRNPSPRLPDRWPPQGPPVPQTSRWAFRRVQSEDPWPRLSNRAFERSCGISHSETSRSSPALRIFCSDSRPRRPRPQFPRGPCMTHKRS